MEPAARQPFEISVDRLEAIVRELESGAPPLETSLELFAEGMKLAEQCREQLEAAEGSEGFALVRSWVEAKLRHQVDESRNYLFQQAVYKLDIFGA